MDKYWLDKICLKPLQEQRKICEEDQLVTQNLARISQPKMMSFRMPRKKNFFVNWHSLTMLEEKAQKWHHLEKSPKSIPWSTGQLAFFYHTKKRNFFPFINELLFFFFPSFVSPIIFVELFLTYKLLK